MAFRKSPDSRPQVSEVFPAAAIPGGEFQVRGRGFGAVERPVVRFGDTPAPLVASSDSFLIVRVPENTSGSDLLIGTNGEASAPRVCVIGSQIADGLHPVASPAVDRHGTVYSTFSGSRGQKTPVSVYKADPGGPLAPFVSDITNATGLALDQDDVLYVSSRQDGVVYRISSTGSVAVYVEGMGVATGIAFDRDENLYVGDRSGTIFKVSRERQIYVFATLEPSISAYHLAFGPDGCLYVAGPTTSSYDAVHRITPAGEAGVFFRGLGRPQGLAFDVDGNLYVAASYAGRRGVIRISPEAKPELFLSGPSIVGLAFTPQRDLIVATQNALYGAKVDVDGLRVP